MTFHLVCWRFDKFSHFHGILVLYEYSGRGMTLFYITFTGVNECRDFTAIFPRIYCHFADFYGDFLAVAALVVCYDCVNASH